MTSPCWRQNLAGTGLSSSEVPVSAGRFLLCLESGREYDNPDDTICALCSWLKRLSAKGRRAWRLAHKKEFDIGYEVVLLQRVSQFSLRSDTLMRISNLGATLGVTFYANPKNERKVPPKSALRKRKRK